MQAIVYLINKIGSLFSKKKIGKLLVILSIISIIVFSLAVFVNNNEKSKKQKQLLASYKQIPLEGEFVQQELIVQFHEGYSPDELKGAIKRKQNSSLILKPFIYIRTVANNLYGGLDSQAILIKIDNELKAVGVISYNKLVKDTSSNSLGRFYKLSFNRDVDLKSAQKKLSQLYYIASTEPNRIFHLDRDPDDPSYRNGQLWGMAKIKAPQAWDTTIGSLGITVAVLDSGIDASHPEFAGRIVPGHDYIDNDSDPNDDLGHGTHVAGTIGAIGNNGVGVVGVNWDVKILPLRICKKTNIPPKFNTCNLDAAIPGIQYAINNNARVINMSLGGPGSCSFAMQNAINAGIIAGITFAIAAGNDNENTANHSPGNCSGVITVGASNSSDQRSIFSGGGASNYGSIVEIAAPGSSIYSTVPGGYTSYSGTSMATPHVAGAAALLLSVNSTLSPAQVSQCLIDNADPISTDQPIGPRLNIFRAISACGGGPMPTLPAGVTPTLTPPVISTPTITGVPGRFSLTVDIWTDNNNDGIRNGGDTPYPGATLNLNNSSGVQIASGITDTSGKYTFPNLSPGSYSVDVIISGHTYTHPVDITNENFTLVLRNSSGVSITPPVVITPPITPIQTQTPVPTAGGGGGDLTPIPTPQTSYNCVQDPNCTSQQKNLHLCALICSPQ